MKLICLNFKMNLLEKDIINYLNVIDKKKLDNIVFFPNNIHLSYFKNKYIIGSQDISFKDFGSITGDTSIHQLKEMGITYTLIGHSERRKYYNDDKYIKDKLKLALQNNIKAILCIGETLDDKKSNLKEVKLIEQLNILKDLNINDNNLIIAYEPIWSIGTNIIPNNIELLNTILFIKNYLKDTFNLDLKVLYGGSVNLNNIHELEKINLDGYLIGSFSLNPNNLIELLDKIN